MLPRPPRIVLASASPARLATLRAAGLDPEVVVSGVEEDGVTAATPGALAAELARRKAAAVAGARDWPAGTVVLGCDSLLELDGAAHGKPGSAAEATARWRRMRGRFGLLHTGHHVLRTGPAGPAERAATATTVVHFADLTDAEIDAYVGTGEPLAVAGGFTIDGLGGPFVTGVEGDPHNVVGISLPLLRTLLADLGIGWPELWVRPATR